LTEFFSESIAEVALTAFQRSFTKCPATGTLLLGEAANGSSDCANSARSCIQEIKARGPILGVQARRCQPHRAAAIAMRDGLNCILKINVHAVLQMPSVGKSWKPWQATHCTGFFAKYN
jgi:hypothetical protein